MYYLEVVTTIKCSCNTYSIFLFFAIAPNLELCEYYLYTFIDFVATSSVIYYSEPIRLVSFKQ